MVGVRRTNSCETCRRRRVKCDEVRPVCGQCAKKSRECTESPLPDFIWVKAGNRHSAFSARSEPGEASDKTLAATSESQTFSLLTAKPTSNGAVFHKYRIGYGGARPQSRDRRTNDLIPRPPELTATDRLRLEFVAAYYNSRPGFCISQSSYHLHQIPRHLGQSVALDDAVTCLVRTHGALVRGGERDNLHEESYYKALNSLQSALEDARLCRHSTTLATISMLTMAEAMGRSGINHNYVKHSGGMTAFIRLAGRECAGDELGKSMILTGIGPMIAEAFISRTPCLLSEAEWFWLYQKDQGPQLKRDVEIRQVFQLSALATIVAEIRTVRDGLLKTGRVEDLVALFERLVQLHSAIHESKADMDLALEEEHIGTQPVWYHAPSDETSPFPYDCEFVNHSVACTVVLNWGLTIHVNEVMRELHGRLAKLDAAPADTKSTVDRAEEESRRYADDICGSIAYAQQFAPLGSGFLAYAVCLAWRFVPEHAKGWMLEELKKMNGSTMNCYQASWLDAISDMFVS